MADAHIVQIATYCSHSKQGRVLVQRSLAMSATRRIRWARSVIDGVRYPATGTVANLGTLAGQVIVRLSALAPLAPVVVARMTTLR
jgi:hypothetical protein